MLKPELYRNGDPVPGIRGHEVIEVMTKLLHSYVTLLILPLYINSYRRNEQACAPSTLHCIMRWHISSVSVCHQWLWKKCVIAALTTRWHSALRQIPRGLSIPQRTPSSTEKQEEGGALTEEEEDWEVERPVLSILCLYTVFWIRSSQRCCFSECSGLVTLGYRRGIIKLKAFNNNEYPVL